MATLQDLKQEATDLGIEFSANIGAAKLAEKIEGHYKSQETSGEEIQAAVAAKEQSEEKPAVKGKEDRYSRAKKREDNARKTRIITVTDNDTRENNQTTVAVANCSNLYFDLGTVYIPLNIPVEVRQGHIDVLANVEIPLHVKDSKSGLFRTEIRKRYSISYEQVGE